MHFVVPIAVGLAVLAWGSAVVHAFVLFGHRRADVSASRLFFSGISWFNRDNFESGAWKLHRRFLLSFAAFFVAILGLMGASVLAETSMR